MTDEIFDLLVKKYEGKKWIPILVADILSEKIAGRLEEVGEKSSTQIVDWKNKKVTGRKKIFSSKVPGKLYELVFRSDSGNYYIEFEIDGYMTLKKTFDELVEMSRYVDSVVAFHEDEYYILNLSNYSWLKSAKFTLYVNEEINFSTIFVKYDEFE